MDLVTTDIIFSVLVITMIMMILMIVILSFSDFPAPHLDSEHI